MVLLLQPLALPPRVLFGPRTSRLDALSSSSITLRSLSNQNSYAALHATVEASDACSALRVARTIFFGQGIDRARVQLQLEQQALATAGQTCGQTLGQVSDLARSLSSVDFEVDQVDLYDLMAWYCCVVDAAWACMQHFAAQVRGSANLWCYSSMKYTFKTAAAVVPVMLAASQDMLWIPGCGCRGPALLALNMLQTEEFVSMLTSAVNLCMTCLIFSVSCSLAPAGSLHKQLQQRPSQHQQLQRNCQHQPSANHPAHLQQKMTQQRSSSSSSSSVCSS
jgi:hypothetical protein